MKKTAAVSKITISSRIIRTSLNLPIFSAGKSIDIKKYEFR